jgi:hypothetical protein
MRFPGSLALNWHDPPIFQSHYSYLQFLVFVMPTYLVFGFAGPVLNGVTSLTLVLNYCLCAHSYDACGR